MKTNSCWMEKILSILSSCKKCLACHYKIKPVETLAWPMMKSKKIMLFTKKGFRTSQQKIKNVVAANVCKNKTIKWYKSCI